MPLETISELRVRYAETDQMGVVYHANYLIWCEIGRTDLIRAVGTPYAEIERAGVMLAVSEATMRFHASARYDDPIRIRTWISSVRSRAVVFSYRIEHAETNVLLVTASTALMSLSRDARPRTLPDGLRAQLEAALTVTAVE